jgi:excisionase family DNA binding protein
MDMELLNVEEAAAFLKVAVKTIYTMTSKQVIPFVKIGGSVRFVRADLEAWVAGKAVPLGGEDERTEGGSGRRSVRKGTV